FLAAYNAGPRRLDDYLSNNRPLPDETRHYVAMIGPSIVGVYPVNRSPAEDYAMNALPIDIPKGTRYGRAIQLASNRGSGGGWRGGCRGAGGWRSPSYPAGGDRGSRSRSSTRWSRRRCRRRMAASGLFSPPSQSRCRSAVVDRQPGTGRFRSAPIQARPWRM